jgi:hypothetical protein
MQRQRDGGDVYEQVCGKCQNWCIPSSIDKRQLETSMDSRTTELGWCRIERRIGKRVGKMMTRYTDGCGDCVHHLDGQSSDWL